MTALGAIADPAVLAATLDGLGDGILVVGGGEVLVALAGGARDTEQVRWCATTTSAGTAPATPTGRPARRSPTARILALGDA